MIGDPLPESDPLTGEELLALPEGVDHPVIIIWSGGNGPHAGTVFLEGGRAYYTAPGYEGNERMRYYNPIRGFGTTAPLTRVWLVETDKNPVLEVDPHVG